MNRLFTLFRTALLSSKALPVVCVVLTVATFGTVMITAKEVGLFDSAQPASMAQKPTTKHNLDDPASGKTTQPTTTAPNTPSTPQTPTTAKPSTGAASGNNSTATGGSGGNTSGNTGGGNGCAAGVTGSTPACALAPPATTSGGKHWNVTFSEEFNGSDYDHSKLTPCFDWNYGGCTESFNQGYERYAPSQVTVSGGVGHLVAAPLSPALSSSACYNSSCTYQSGLLSTARLHGTDPDTAYLYKFTYGYVEASLKVPNTQGFFAAWWMLPADPTYTYTYNGYRYEIDILEELGHDPTDIEMHYHWGNGPSDHYSPNESNPVNGACPAINYSNAFHRYGVDWEPTYVAFYIDGVKCGQHNATAGAPVPDVPMQLILNQMVSNSWQRSIGKPLLNNTLTNDLQVDYMRVYQQQ